MVGDTLGVCSERQVLRADLGRALAVAQPFYMVGGHLLGDVVHTLFYFVSVVERVAVGVFIRRDRAFVQPANKFFSAR